MTWLRQTNRRTRHGLVLIGLPLLAIALATLPPDYSRHVEPLVACVVCGQRGVADALSNLILFAPLGVGLTSYGLRSRRAVLTGALVSAFIEFAQFALPGRDPSIGDVIFNTGGTWLGTGIAWLLPTFMHLDERIAAWLSLASAGTLAVAVLFTGWLLQPSFPQSTYFGQWTPELGHLQWYRGTVHRATLAGHVVRDGRIENSAWARAALSRGEAVEVDFGAGPPVPALAPLVSVADGDQREIMLVGLDRRDLVLRYRIHATALRLDQPDLRVLGGVAGLLDGSNYRVRVWSPSRGAWCVEGPLSDTCGLGFTAGVAWGFLLYPESFPPWLKDLLGAGWIAALSIPVGFLARRHWQSTAAVLLVVAVLALAPGFVGLRPTRGIEWLGAALGMAAGAVASGIAHDTRAKHGLGRGTAS